MSTTTLDAVLTPELDAQIRKLSRADKGRLFDILTEGATGISDEPLPPVNAECKAVTRYRVEEDEAGREPGFLVEETLRIVRERLAVDTS